MHVASVPLKRPESFTVLHFFSARRDYLRRLLARPAKDGVSHDAPNADGVVVQVRRAHDRSDFQKLHDLFVEYEADLSEELRHGAVSDVTALDETYVQRDAAFLAACEGDEIGCVAVRAFDTETALMLHLFVRPERRGLGAARLLVTTAIEFARAQRFGRIVLDTHKYQLVAAYRLYRSLGFEECEPFTTVTYEFPTFMQLPLG